MQMNANTQRKKAEIRDWPLVAWWIRVTSPAPGSPASQRNPQWREEVVSLLFPVVFLQILLPMLTAIGSNILNLIILFVVLCIDIGALFLKRAGRMYIAGIIVICSYEFGLGSALLGPGHLTIENLGLLGLLVQATVATMAFFPPLGVFFVCMLNCTIIFSILEFFPHTAALNQTITEHFSSLFTAPALLEIFVAGVSFVIVRALLKEIKRADNAEEFAQLRQSEAELRKREAQQAQQIEEGIQLILQALNTAAAKGDFSMRVPLAQENILWRVGYSINNLLARLQGFKQEKAELDKTRAVANQLTECIRQGQQFPLNNWTGTSLDQVIIELNKQPTASPKLSNQSSPHAGSYHTR